MLESLCLVRLGIKRLPWRFLSDEHSESPHHWMQSVPSRHYIDIDSFYEGHTMDLVTFATRVCKLLGVETMIGTVVTKCSARLFG